MKTSLFAILPALGMISSVAFAAWPTWFMDRVERGTRERLFYKPLFCILFFAGCFGWFTIFQAGARSIFKTEGSTIAGILTCGIIFLIYAAALRADMLDSIAKRQKQAERNARRSPNGP